MRDLLGLVLAMGTVLANGQEIQVTASSNVSQNAQAGPSVNPGYADPKPQWMEREFMMPAPGAPKGLDVLQVEVQRPGKHPLAILTHGTSNVPEERATVTPWVFLPQAMWFARRGYVVLVVVRKGFGNSSGATDGGIHGGCQRSGGEGFTEVGESSADDLLAAAKYAAGLSEVDTATIISAGVSTGGFAQVALTTKPPEGLKAAISFAGGRGGDGKENNCNLSGLISAFQEFGKKSKLPMLWIYSENDHWFPPAMAHSFDEAFKKSGGNDQFVMVPAYGDDGHHFYNDVAGWSQIVEKFLKEQRLLPLKELLSEPPVPNVIPPAGLKENGIRAFHNYLLMGSKKAFATNGRWHWGTAFGQWDQARADEKALTNCEKAAKGDGQCKVVSRGQ